MSISQATTWLQPSTATKDTSDHYAWARENAVFLDAAELADELRAGRADVLVLDTRDDDAAGGHVRGALHWPDSTFDACIDELMVHLRTGAYSRIVLHCMESVRRGPRCCRKLRHRLAAERGADDDARHHLPAPSAVVVLRGGADQWVRAHWSNRALVDGFDNAYWGFAAAESGEPPSDAIVTDHAVATCTHRLHALYRRPDDQALERDGIE